MPEALTDPQVEARGMVRTIERGDGTEVRFLGFPAQLSTTPASYRAAPPRAGQDTRAVLGDTLGVFGEESERLIDIGAVA